MSFFIGLLAGFGLCAYITNAMLLKKARNNEYPVTDDSGCLFWRKNKGES